MQIVKCYGRGMFELSAREISGGAEKREKLPCRALTGGREMN